MIKILFNFILINFIYGQSVEQDLIRKPYPKKYGNCIVTEKIDLMDDSKIILIFIPSEGDDNVTLYIRCNQNKIDLWINWDTYISNEPVRVQERLDKNEMFEMEWHPSNDGTATFHKYPESFIKNLLKSKKLVLRLTPYNSNSITEVFMINNLKEALNHFKDNCNLELTDIPSVFDKNVIDRLNIETVAKVGDKLFVIINGFRYREGEFIISDPNILIQKINNNYITFKVDQSIIVKNLGD
tara:strand:+ start:1966 stop:2688 length:723 start_codon:yes stop_codon:yes gene_type:complete